MCACAGSGESRTHSRARSPWIPLTGEAPHSLVLRVEGVEDGHQAGDRQQVVIALVHVQQLQAAGGLRERAVAGDELTKSAAVDVGDLAEVYDDRQAILLNQ